MEQNNTNSNKNNSDSNNNSNNKGPSFKSTLFMMFIAILLTFVFFKLYTKFASGTQTEIEYSEFLDMVEDKSIKSIEITSNRITIIPKKQEDSLNDNISYYVVRVSDDDLVNRLDKAGVKFKGMDESGGAILNTIIYYLVMFAVVYLGVVLFVRFLKKSGGMMGGIGKSNAKVYVEKKTGVTFADVAGQEESKESLTEMVDFLHNPKKYLAIGAKLPKGALLVGPPGTGKTLLAKAVAGEASVPFFSLAGSDFVEMYVGLGASRVRDLFKQAEAMAPCIVFIDEIDAIGKSRDNRYGGDSEREQTLNQLLSEMDGFDTSKGIVILAATNRPEVLDQALLRPGRFDRRVIVEKPDYLGRLETFKVHAKDVKIDETVDFEELAMATSGAVGADIANIINEAAILAVKNKREYVCQDDLFESVEVVFAGKEKKDRILSEREKTMVAYHEVGHALLSALQKNTEPVQKITIVPRTMGSLGYVWQTPEEEKYLSTQAEMEADLVTFVGGRAAEALKFDTVSTGASNDIEQATKMARSMVTIYGMSEEFGMVSLESVQNRYLDGTPALNCSDKTATKIDTLVSDMIKKAYNKAYKLLKKNESVLDKIATHLIEKETITGKEFRDIYKEYTGIELREPADRRSAALEAAKMAAVTESKAQDDTDKGKTIDLVADNDVTEDIENSTEDK